MWEAAAHDAPPFKYRIHLLLIYVGQQEKWTKKEHRVLSDAPIIKSLAAVTAAAKKKENDDNAAAIAAITKGEAGSAATAVIIAASAAKE